jgi:hypothetical protein
MKKARLAAIVVMQFFCSVGFAQQGKNGALTINSNNYYINEYTSLTADATSGSTAISVAGNTLNAHNRFSSPLSTFCLSYKCRVLP